MSARFGRSDRRLVGAVFGQLGLVLLVVDNLKSGVVLDDPLQNQMLAALRIDDQLYFIRSDRII